MSTLLSANDDENNLLKNYLDRKLVAFGDFKYAYMRLNKKNLMEASAITNYPDEWVKLYKENNYQYIDPVVLSALQRVSPFAWDEHLSINSLANSSEIFNHSKRYNVTNGYTFVLHDHNHNLAMLSLMVNDAKSIDIEEKIYDKKNSLQMLLVSVHERFITLNKEVARNKSLAPADKKDLLTLRENEILYWVSMGKTYLEIAIILDVKVRTVKFHIGNVVKKMGVANAKHAIRLAAEWQLVKPVCR